MSIHIKIDREGWNKLIRGGIVETASVQGDQVSIIMEDIGYELMQKDMNAAINAHLAALMSETSKVEELQEALAELKAKK